MGASVATYSTDGLSASRSRSRADTFTLAHRDRCWRFTEPPKVRTSERSRAPGAFLKRTRTSMPAAPRVLASLRASPLILPGPWARRALAEVGEVVAAASATPTTRAAQRAGRMV